MLWKAQRPWCHRPLGRLVLARIDRLTIRNKRALQAASVIGKRFSYEALCFLADDENYRCEALIAADLVRLDDADYLFAHALIQEGVYLSLLKRTSSSCTERLLGGMHSGNWCCMRSIWSELATRVLARPTWRPRRNNFVSFALKLPYGSLSAAADWRALMQSNARCAC